RLWTKGSAWFSGEEGMKGSLRIGEFADLAVLSDDYFSVPGEHIKHISSVLTMVGGRIVHGDGAFAKHAPALPPPSPDWSPVRTFGGYRQSQPAQQHVRACHDDCVHACAVHGHRHEIAWAGSAPTADLRTFWGVLRCSCFAI